MQFDDIILYMHTNRWTIINHLYCMLTSQVFAFSFDYIHSLSQCSCVIVRKIGPVNRNILITDCYHSPILVCGHEGQIKVSTTAFFWVITPRRLADSAISPFLLDQPSSTGIPRRCCGFGYRPRQ